MATLPKSPARDEVLNSWKDIAKYLDRGVRTVQRWELELALPVRRPRGKPRSGVLALRSELDHWLSACPATRHGTQIDTLPGHDFFAPLVQNTSNLVSQSRMLRTELVRFRADLVRLQEDLRLTMNRLTTTVQCFRAEPVFKHSRTAKVA